MKTQPKCPTLLSLLPRNPFETDVRGRVYEPITSKYENASNLLRQLAASYKN